MYAVRLTYLVKTEHTVSRKQYVKIKTMWTFITLHDIVYTIYVLHKGVFDINGNKKPKMKGRF